MPAVSSAAVIQATSNAPWEVAIAPFRVTDQIYYIGNIWVGAYLIDTKDGLILLDTMCAETVYLMVDAIYQPCSRGPFRQRTDAEKTERRKDFPFQRR